MGRRSRTRERADGAPAPKRSRTPARGAGAAPVRSPGVRRVVGIYTGLTVVLAVLVLTGIALLGTTLGSVIVIAYAGLGAGLLHHWYRGRVATLTLTDEDRMLQTVANGLLIMAVGFAVLSGIVAGVA